MRCHVRLARTILQANFHLRPGSHGGARGLAEKLEARRFKVFTTGCCHEGRSLIAESPKSPGSCFASASTIRPIFRGRDPVQAALGSSIAARTHWSWFSPLCSEIAASAAVVPASVSCASLRFAPLRFAQLRFAPMRFASQRSAPMRSRRISRFSARHAFRASAPFFS
jgi:hypothetical protein